MYKYTSSKNFEKKEILGKIQKYIYTKMNKQTFNTLRGGRVPLIEFGYKRKRNVLWRSKNVYQHDICTCEVMFPAEGHCLWL